MPVLWQFGVLGLVLCAVLSRYAACTLARHHLGDAHAQRLGATCTTVCLDAVRNAAAEGMRALVEAEHVEALPCRTRFTTALQK